MNPTAIYSKTGKGVQEASGRTSHLSRADRAVLAAIDGKSTVAELNAKFDKFNEAKFQQLIEKMDRDGFVREVSPGAAVTHPRPAMRRPAAPPTPKRQEEEEGGELDFTSFIPTAPKAEAERAKAASQGPSATQSRAATPAQRAETTQSRAATPAPRSEATQSRAAPSAPPRAEATQSRAAPITPPRAEATQSRAATTTPPGATTSQRLDLAAKAHAEAEQRKAEQDVFDFRAREQAEAKARAEAAARVKAEAEAKAKAEAAAKEKAEAEAKAKAAAEERQKAEADAKAKAEAEAKARADSEAKSKALRDAAIRAASEARQKAEAEAKAKGEAEERARKEAEERARIETEMNAKLDAERKAREEAEARAKEEGERLAKQAEERARREVEEKARRESEALREQLEKERKAREEVELKAREEEERRRKEEEEAKRKADEEAKRKEDEEAKRKAEEEAKRKAEEEAKRKAEEEAKRKEEEEAKRKADEEEARRKTEEEIQRKTDEARLEARRKAEEEAQRKEQEEGERRRAEESRLREQEERERRREEQARRAESPAASALSADLLADLDNFAKRDDEAQQARVEAERKAREDAERKAQEAAERQQAQAREAEARRRQEEETRAQREADERRRRQEEEARQREDEARVRAEADAREREAREAAQAEARQRQLEEASGLKSFDEEEDIEISDDELDLDEVRAEERVLSKSARGKEAAKREREESEPEPELPTPKKKESKVLAFLQKRKEKKETKKVKAPKAPKLRKAPKPLAPKEVQAKRIRRRKFGKPLGLIVLVLLVAGVGVLHVMPMPTGDYESAASASLGVPVRISSARMSLVTGLEVKLEGITIGGGARTVRVVRARAYPALGSLLSSEKEFSRVELDGVRMPQSMIAQGLLGALRGGALRAEHIVLKEATFEGPLTLAPLDVTVRMAPDGRVRRATVQGKDGLEVKLTPKGKQIDVEAKAEVLTVPFLKGVALADFGGKGTASADGLKLSAWDARLFDGVVSGTLELRWGAQWSASGTVVGKGVNAAVFAPALLSEGKADAKGNFAMSGANPAALQSAARIEGGFTISKGVLGSFDLSRGIQTKGRQASGRTLFAELSGNGVYQSGGVALRDLNMGAGKLNAAGTVDIAADGSLAGRVVADVESGPRGISETFNLVGTVKEPRLESSRK